MNEETDKNVYENINFASRQTDKNNLIDINAVAETLYASKRVNPKSFQNWLSDPYKFVNELQALSEKMYTQNGILKEFIQYKSLILTQDHYIYPTNALRYNDKDTIRKDELKVAEYLDRFSPIDLQRYVAQKVMQDGEVYLYKRETKTGFLIQEIPNNICKIFSVDEYGVSRYGVDIKKIDKKDLPFLPKELSDAYDKYNNAKDKKKLSGFSNNFYIVSDFGVAFSLTKWKSKGIPYFLHLFSGLMNLSDVELLDNVNNKLENHKIIHQEAPTKDGKMLMEMNVVEAYHMALKSIVPDGCGTITSPMDIKTLSLGDGKLKTYDYQNYIKKGIYDNAGIASELFNGDSKTKEAIILSSIVDTLVPIKIQNEVEKYLNFELSKKFKKGGWKVSFLPTTYYSRPNDIKLEKENLTLYGSKKKYLAVQGFTPLQALNILYAEDLLSLNEFMKPMQTSHTISSKGRPSDSDLSVDTEIQVGDEIE